MALVLKRVASPVEVVDCQEMGIHSVLPFHRAQTQHWAHWAPRDEPKELQLAPEAPFLGFVQSAQSLVGLRVAMGSYAGSN